MNENDELNKTKKGQDKIKLSMTGFMGGIVVGAFILFMVYIQLSPNDLYNTPYIFFVLYFGFFGLCGALGGEKIIEGILKVLSYIA